MKRIYLKIMFTIALFIGVLTPNIVFAKDNFGDYNNRLEHNTQMYINANKEGTLTINRYIDKSLKDLKGTNYKAISSTNQTLIKKLATTIIEGKTTLSKTEKLKSFHNFIRDNLELTANPTEVLGTSYDNPVTIVKYYNATLSNEIPATQEGYAELFVALARSYDIPTRIVEGYFQYDAINTENEWGANISSEDINHVWCESYVNGRWIVIDIIADEYNTSEETEMYGLNYFDIGVEDLSKTHIIFSKRNGSKDRKYIDNVYETTRLKTFLNKKTNGIKNGKRINKSYTTTKPYTWFNTKDKTSIGDGSGRIQKLILKDSKKLYGSLDFSKFTEMTYFQGSHNEITSAKVTNCPKLKKVYLGHNKIKTANFTCDKSLTYLSLQSNPLKEAKYSFRNGKSYAIVKSNDGGTISVLYQKTSNGYKHILKATPYKTHLFKGWYKSDGTLITKNKKLTIYKNKTFSYVAKYKEKTYIYVSIKNQKVVYYKRGKVLLSSKVVTGNTGDHDTPKGTFSIKHKARNLYLIGPDYESFVSYWMLISNKLQVGFHDATWRTTFGGKIYKGNGSHGCINMPLGKAQKLYEIVPKGTTVIIK